MNLHLCAILPREWQFTKIRSRFKPATMWRWVKRSQRRSTTVYSFPVSFNPSTNRHESTNGSPFLPEHLPKPNLAEFSMGSTTTEHGRKNRSPRNIGHCFETHFAYLCNWHISRTNKIR